MTKRKSTRLEDFSPDQLHQLTDDYFTIRREVRKMVGTGITKIALPDFSEREQQIAALRELTSKGDLDIRISYAGNLNVFVRGRDEDIGYLGVLRRPATDWCVPHGRYFP